MCGKQCKVILLCKDCIHFDDGLVGENIIGDILCMKPIASPVYGSKGKGISPMDERASLEVGDCGPKGIFFTQKEQQQEKNKAFIGIFNGLFLSALLWALIATIVMIVK